VVVGVPKLVVGVVATKSTAPNRSVFTKRDKVVLCWLCHQYACSFEVLPIKLGKTNPDVGRSLSRWGTRNQVRRWELQGLVRTEHLLGQTWVTPTQQGLTRVGLDYPVWPMPVTRLAHVNSVNIVRLWHEITTGDDGQHWVSERELFAERGRHASWHIGDAAVVNAPAGVGTGSEPHWLVEVELTPKTVGRYVTEVFESLRPTVSGLVYFVPEPHLDRVRSLVTTAQQQARRGGDVSLTFRVLPSLADVVARLEGGE
jgi:hypothetical protein